MLKVMKTTIVPHFQTFTCFRTYSSFSTLIRGLLALFSCLTHGLRPSQCTIGAFSALGYMATFCRQENSELQKSWAKQESRLSSWRLAFQKPWQLLCTVDWPKQPERGTVKEVGGEKKSTFLSTFRIAQIEKKAALRGKSRSWEVSIRTAQRRRCTVREQRKFA